MHKYLQAAGFSKLENERQIYDFIKHEVMRPEHLRDRASLAGGCSLLEYRYPVSPELGLCVGILDYGTGEGRVDYYYPYFDSEEISSNEICSVERYTERENYAGLIDEYKIGLSLIFFVTNPLAYRKLPDREIQFDFRGTSLTAFCNQATVILPVMKTEADLEGMKDSRREQETLIEAARNGDEEAIETLTATDMDMYHQISKRIENEDLYSVVEQSLMPSGIECDQYSIIAEITAVDETENSWSQEPIWLLGLSCNEVEFSAAVRKADLTGEPAVGRRLKGKIWLQGTVNFDRPVQEDEE